MGFAYVANINKIYEYMTEDAEDIKSIGILCVGIHILTQSDLVLKVLKNKILKENILRLFIELVAGIAREPEDSPTYFLNYARAWFFSKDIMFISRSKAAPLVLKETDFLERMIAAMQTFYLVDLVKQTDKMEEYEQVRVTSLAIEIETTYIGKIKKFIYQLTDV